MKSFFSSSLIKLALLAFLIGTPLATVSAVVTDPFGFDFTKSKKTTAGDTYFYDIKESPKVGLTDGTYDLGAYVGFLGKDISSNSFQDEVADDLYDVEYKNQSGVIKNMEHKTGVSDTLGDNDFLVYQKSSFTAGHKVDPGKYTVNLKLKGAVSDSFEICLPTFTSSIGKSVGNETCGNTPPPVTPIVGKCNETFTTQAQSAITDAQKTSICTTGTLASFTGTGPWTWKCLGNNNAVSTDDVTCTAQKKSTETPPGTPVVGKCNEVLTSTAQTSIKETDSLCTSGIATTVSGSGPWTWKCLGDNTSVDTDDVTCTAQMKNTVMIPPGGVATTKQCADGSQDCYELSGGFSQALGALGTKISSIGSADSLGGFLNAIIAFGIAIGGVITVVFLMWEGVNYMRSDNAETKSKMKSRMLNTVLGFILLLSIYTLLRTINPDLLNLTPRIDSADFITGGDPDTVDEPTVKTQYSNFQAFAKSHNIPCDGTGGASKIAVVAKAMQGKITYSMEKRGQTCANDTFCLDCSGFVNAVYSCVGISSPGFTTANIFGQGSTQITNKTNTTINGKALTQGDLLGWVKGSYTKGKQEKFGHVVMYIGGGKVIESTGANKKPGQAIQIKDTLEYGERLKMIKDLQ